MTDIGYYKLTKEDIQTFTNMHIIKPDYKAMVILIAKTRHQGCFLNDLTVKEYRRYLNKAKTVWIQPVHFYGGENFSEPYHWLAEITGSTKTGVTRFMNKYDIQLPHMTY